MLVKIIILDVSVECMLKKEHPINAIYGLDLTSFRTVLTEMKKFVKEIYEKKKKSCRSHFFD